MRKTPIDGHAGACGFIGWAMTRTNRFQRNYKKNFRPSLRSATMTDEQWLQTQQLDALRKAIEAIIVQPWTDEQWQTWLKTIRTK